MRALILTDEAFLAREPGMLRRLEVGLADEGVSVIHALPDTAGELAESGLFAQSAVYPTRAPWFMERWRVRQLLDAVHETDTAMGGSDRAIDVVHVFGESAWGLGVRTAREVGCPLVVEVWAAGLVSRAAGLPSALRGEVSCALLAPDKQIADALQREDAGLPVRTVAWGVLCPGQANPPPAPSEAIGVMLIGAGTQSRDFVVAFEGLCEAAKRQPRMMIFADAYPVRASGAWTIAESSGVLDRITLVPRMEGARSLVLRGSVLVSPESLGEHRTILLDAMAHGMSVVAQRDPMVSWLKEGRTAVLVSRPGVEEWARAVDTLLRDPARAASLGESARQYVRESHRASSHVSVILDVYERLQAGETPTTAKAVKVGS